MKEKIINYLKGRIESLENEIELNKHEPEQQVWVAVCHSKRMELVIALQFIENLNE